MKYILVKPTEGATLFYVSNTENSLSASDAKVFTNLRYLKILRARLNNEFAIVPIGESAYQK